LVYNVLTWSAKGEKLARGERPPGVTFDHASVMTHVHRTDPDQTQEELEAEHRRRLARFALIDKDPNEMDEPLSPPQTQETSRIDGADDLPTP
jgi:hypothetical protein